MGRRLLYGEAQAYAEHADRLLDAERSLQVEFVKALITAIYKTAGGR